MYKELTREQNMQRARPGMGEDRGVNYDRFHPMSHGCTSRSLEYFPVRPPNVDTQRLPQLYRSELCEHLAAGASKFSPAWEAVHSKDYGWRDFFLTFPRRPDELNQMVFDAWAKENPAAAARLDAEWEEFLKEFA